MEYTYNIQAILFIYSDDDYYHFEFGINSRVSWTLGITVEPKITPEVTTLIKLSLYPFIICNLYKYIQQVSVGLGWMLSLLAYGGISVVKTVN
jgi:hypothetical protein